MMQSRFYSPGLEGLGLEPNIMDALGALGEAAAAEFRRLAALINNASKITVPTDRGDMSLSDALRYSLPRPNDLRPCSLSWARAKRREWYYCDGRNGTPKIHDMGGGVGRWIRGVEWGCDAPTTGGSTSFTGGYSGTTGSYADTSTSVVAAGYDTVKDYGCPHTHSFSVPAGTMTPPNVGVIWMMKA